MQYATHVSSEDLTARARIRDAAIDLFAEKGIGTATIRDIAQRAGVSSGLLRHHFGSKEGLRDACDEHALARLAALRQQVFSSGQVGEEAILSAMRPEAIRLQSYLIRSMMDGSTGGRAMFLRMVEAGEDWLGAHPVRTDDVRAFSAVLVAMQMGMFLMNDQIADSLGIDMSQTRFPYGHPRILRAVVELFAQPLLTPDQADQALKALDRLTAYEEKET